MSEQEKCEKTLTATGVAVDELGRFLSVSAFCAAGFVALRYNSVCEKTSPWLTLPIGIILLIGSFSLVILGCIRIVYPILKTFQTAENKVGKLKQLTDFVILLMILGAILLIGNLFFVTIELSTKQFLESRNIC